MESSKFAQDAINKMRNGKKERMENEKKGEKKKDGRCIKIIKALLLGIASLFCLCIIMTIIFAWIEVNFQPKKYQKNSVKNSVKNSNEKNRGSSYYKIEKSYSIKKAEETAYKKRKAIKYFIYLKNGARISCKKIPEMKNGMVIMTENKITTKIPASELVKIEGVWQ